MSIRGSMKEARMEEYYDNMVSNYSIVRRTVTAMCVDQKARSGCKECPMCMLYGISDDSCSSQLILSYILDDRATSFASKTRLRAWFKATENDDILEAIRHSKHKLADAMSFMCNAMANKYRSCEKCPMRITPSCTVETRTEYALEEIAYDRRNTCDF